MASLSELIEERRAATLEVSYLTEGGCCIGHGLLKIPEVAVQYGTLAAGDTLAVHAHEGCSEWLVVYFGSVEVELWGEEPHTFRRLHAGDGARLLPGQQHRVIAVERAGVVGVTVPSDDAYPEGYPYAVTQADASAD